MRLKQRKMGIRFIRCCCGRNTFQRHCTWTIRYVRGCEIDCEFCGVPLFIKREQFEGLDPDTVPFQIVMVDLHKDIQAEYPDLWPADDPEARFVAHF